MEYSNYMIICWMSYFQTSSLSPYVIVILHSVNGLYLIHLWAYAQSCPAVRQMCNCLNTWVGLSADENFKMTFPSTGISKIEWGCSNGSCGCLSHWRETQLDPASPVSILREVGLLYLWSVGFSHSAGLCWFPGLYVSLHVSPVKN